MAACCQHCGNVLHASARFCSGCGAAVANTQPYLHQPLIRPRSGRIIGGICIALARANGWDVALVRILALVACLFSSGFVGVAYLAAWIGIPEEPWPYPGPYPGSYPGPHPGPYPGSYPGAYPPHV
ncbi:MAG: PspC domain-containing protein [Terracidiphilus sp.]